MKQAYLRDMFKKASKTATDKLLWLSSDPLSPTPSYSSVVNATENTEGEPDDPEWADEGNAQMEYSSDYMCGLSIGAETKYYLQELKPV